MGRKDELLDEIYRALGVEIEGLRKLKVEELERLLEALRSAAERAAASVRVGDVIGARFFNKPLREVTIGDIVELLKERPLMKMLGLRGGEGGGRPSRPQG